MKWQSAVTDYFGKTVPSIKQYGKYRLLVVFFKVSLSFLSENLKSESMEISYTTGHVIIIYYPFTKHQTGSLPRNACATCET